MTSIAVVHMHVHRKLFFAYITAFNPWIYCTPDLLQLTVRKPLKQKNIDIFVHRYNEFHADTYSTELQAVALLYCMCMVVCTMHVLYVYYQKLGIYLCRKYSSKPVVQGES